MVVFVETVFVMAVSLKMKIEGQDIVLPVSAGDDIGGIAVFALVELFEKTETLADTVIFSGIEIQVQPPGQFQ